MPGSHWVALFFRLWPRRIFYFVQSATTYLQHHSTSWIFNCQRLQGLTSNVCGHYCCLYALQSQGTVHDVIREHGFTCSLHLQRYKGGAHVTRSIQRVPCFQPVGASAAVVQVSGIKVSTHIIISLQCLSD